MARNLHWGWLILAYFLGSIFPLSKITGGNLPFGL